MNMLQKFNWKEILQIIFFAIILFGGSHLLSINQKPLPENIEVEAKQKTPWLKKTTEDITEFMNDADAKIFFSERSRSFYSSFSSKVYDKDKLINLSRFLKNQDWQQITLEQFHKLENPHLPYEHSVPINNKTIILCQNGATVLIWTENLIGKYHNKGKDRAISIIVDFNYLSPCYNYTPDKFSKDVQP